MDRGRAERRRQRAGQGDADEGRPVDVTERLIGRALIATLRQHDVRVQAYSTR